MDRPRCDSCHDHRGDRFRDSHHQYNPRRSSRFSEGPPVDSRRYAGGFRRDSSSGVPRRSLESPHCQPHAGGRGGGFPPFLASPGPGPVGFPPPPMVAEFGGYPGPGPGLGGFGIGNEFQTSLPAPYLSIKRNIHLTNKPKRRHEDDGIFCSCSQYPDSNDVCGRDCDCGVLLSSCSSGCKCGSACANKPFQLRPVKKMKLLQTEKCGFSIVADEDINQGGFVIEYVGEVIDDKICEERLWKMKHSGEANFYLCEVNRDMVIDATFKGNKSRYINHSCYPNTEMQKWIIDGETRIGIFATRDIKKGEHVTYDYQ